MKCACYLLQHFVVLYLQVTDLFKEIKCSLAECLYCLACQQPLSRGDTLRLMAFLKADNSISADGTLEPVSVCLLMTMLYCLDISILEQEDAGGMTSALQPRYIYTEFSNVQNGFSSLFGWKFFFSINEMLGMEDLWVALLICLKERAQSR